MKRSWIGILAVSVLSTALAFAADQPARGSGNLQGGGPPGGGPGMRGNFQGRGGGMGMPALTEEQRGLLQEAMQKNNEKLRSLEEKLQAAQKELVEATLAANYEESVVQAKAEAVGKIQVEMTMIRAKALATVAPTLKPEQKQQFVESRMAIMMLTGGGAAMGGRPGALGMRGGPGGGFGEGFNRGERGDRPARER